MKSLIKKLQKYVLKKEIRAYISTLQPNEQLAGKKVIVTGGGKGLGYTIARKLISEGANVLIAGRNIESLKKASQDLNCKYLPINISDVDSLEDFILNANESLGGADILVNNAGISLHEKDFFEVTVDSWQQQFDTNLRGTFFLTQKFVELLKKERRTGNVLIISSETAMMSDVRPYGYTKAALNSMVEGLAYLFAKDGIRINAIAPGITASEMTNYDPKGNLYRKGNMLERVYVPEEIAEVASFLLSDISSCLTGQILVCNNGKTINSRVKVK